MHISSSMYRAILVYQGRMALLGSLESVGSMVTEETLEMMESQVLL